MVLAIGLTAILGVGFRYHAVRLERNLETLHAQQLDIYREVFEVDRLPPGAALRLASERIRVEGLTSKGEESGLAGESPSALEALRGVVAALPSDVRIMLTDLRIDEKQIALHAQTGQHRDAERIAEAIGTIEGLQVRPPRTTRLKSGGVEFALIATRGEQP
jgi:hypothetical protein